MVHILVPLTVALLLLVLQHSHHVARLLLGATVHLILRLLLALLVLLMLLVMVLLLLLLLLVLLVLLVLRVRMLQVVVHRLYIKLVVSERRRVKRLIHVLVEHVDIEFTATSTDRCRVVAGFHDFPLPPAPLLRVENREISSLPFRALHFSSPTTFSSTLLLSRSRSASTF